MDKIKDVPVFRLAPGCSSVSYASDPPVTLYAHKTLLSETGSTLLPARDQEGRLIPADHSCDSFSIDVLLFALKRHHIREEDWANVFSYICRNAEAQHQPEIVRVAQRLARITEPKELITTPSIEEEPKSVKGEKKDQKEGDK